ncbi:MAG TPA: hypothetical protein VFU05_19470 [Cyclobacteriaceae bacterium]|nr:hypothetical protein [Cyclobacteriaceae bacterium]
MKTTRTTIIMICAVLFYLSSHAQFQDSLINNTTDVTINTTSQSGEKAIEVFKINSNKTFLIEKSRTVWVQCENKKGRRQIKRAQIIDIHDQEIKFRPFNKNFTDVTYTEADLLYIGFTSTGRIIIATVSNIIIVSAVVIIYTTALIFAILSGHSSFGSDPDFSWVPLVPFRKNINCYKSMSGERKWGIRIVNRT